MKKIFILIIILICCSCNKKYDVYKMPKDAYINLNENNFIVFEKHTTKELIKDTNVKVLKKDSLINNKIGEHKYTIEYEYNKRKYKYDVTYKIIDNINPVFINTIKEIKVEKNTDEILCDKISYADNYDNKVKCEVVGDYDFTTIGKYNLKFLITDSSNNKNEKNFILNIVDELEKKKEDNHPNYLYINDIKKYKNENTSIGIDISKWQGNIDFSKLKEQGIEFIIMRIGYQKDDDFELDPKFNEYYNEAKKYGFKISVYIHTVALNEEDGIKTAKWVIKNLPDKKVDLPIGYDFESWNNFQKFNTSLNSLSNGYLEFEKTLKKNNLEAILYSSKYYLENVWLNYENSNIWLAHYTDKTDYEGKYMIWQMTSLAKLDGITDNSVDIDILYKKN